jgi:hypothetical protein
MLVVNFHKQSGSTRMKKLALVATVAALVVMMSLSASAQGKMFLNVGGDVLLPLGSFSDAASVGFGGTVRFEYQLMPQLNGTFTTGYLMWSGKTVNSVDMPSYHAIPFLVGAKYYFTPEAKGKAHIYGAAEIGLVVFGVGSKTYTYGPYTYESPSVSETDFALSPSVGVEFPVSDKGMLDISAKYLLITSTGSASNLGVRIGYKFPLN